LPAEHLITEVSRRQTWRNIKPEEVEAHFGGSRLQRAHATLDALATPALGEINRLDTLRKEKLGTRIWNGSESSSQIMWTLPEDNRRSVVILVAEGGYIA
jgi:hypothetical protein